MSNISVTTNQSVIEVTEVNGITVTTPEGQVIDVTVPNSSVSVTNTTDDITVLTSGTLNINSSGVITSVNGDTGPIVVLDTDDISEGTTNKYFSQALARQSLSAGTGISYDNSTGVITNTSINTDTTYTIASASTTGGANLNLVGSDSTTDSVAYKGAGATTVTSTDANTVTISSTDTNTTYTQNASAATGGANLNLVGSDSTTDSIKLASGTNVTVTRTDADTVTISSTDTNTTYTVDATATTGGANLNLTGSDSSTDSVAYLGSGATTVTRTDVNTITIASTDTNTTYTQNFSSTTGGTNLNLVGSDSTTDTVKFADGTGVTVSYTDADTATISIGQSVGTGDSPSFAGGTFGNITVGVDTDNTITTTTGDLVLDSTSGTIILNSNGTLGFTLKPITGFNPNADFTGNIVKGAIRSSTFENAGDIWQFTGGSGATTGISIDNTDKVADRTALVLRNYGGSVPGAIPRNNIIFEAARGSAASPLNLNSGNILGEITANGYTSTGWVSDQVTSVPGIVRFYSTEAWNNGLNNVGTGLRVILQPAATAITAGGTSLVTALDVTPTGTTVQKIFSVNNNRSTGSSDFAVINFSTQKFTSPNYIPTSNGDTLGQFKWNGNTSSGPTSSPGIQPAAVVGSRATEDWTPTANGTEFYFNATKTGTTSQVEVINGGSDSTTFRTDTLNIKDSADAPLPGGDIVYRRTYGCFHKIANVTAAAANTVYEFDWYTDATAHVGNQGVTVTSGNPTRVNIDTQGSYEVVVEMQTKNTANAERTAWIWLAKNGTDLSETRIKVSLRAATSADVYQLITKMWCLDNIADNDYIELRFAVDNTSGISLEYEAAQTSPFVMPAQPSATITVSPIGA